MKLGERFCIFARLHALQVHWNFKGMQHFGFLFAIRPVLRRLYTGDAYLEAETRQAQFFNTHPYFAPICTGVVVKLEEDLAAGTFTKPEMIPVLKNRMSGPLAAVGDAFFWETIRPVLASLAVLGVYCFGPGSDAAIITLVVIGAAYVLPVELLRWQSFQWGYEHGLHVVEVLKKRDFHGSMRRIRNMGALVLGAAALLYLLGNGDLGPDDVPRLVVKGAVLALALWGALKKWSPTFMLYVVAVLGTIAGMYL